MKKIAILAAAVAMSMGVQAETQAPSDQSDITVNAEIKSVIEITGLAETTTITEQANGSPTATETFTVASNIVGGAFSLTMTGQHDAGDKFFLKSTETSETVQVYPSIRGAVGQSPANMSPGTPVKGLKTDEHLGSKTKNAEVRFVITETAYKEAKAGTYSDKFTLMVAAD